MYHQNETHHIYLGTKAKNRSYNEKKDSFFISIIIYCILSYYFILNPFLNYKEYGFFLFDKEVEKYIKNDNQFKQKLKEINEIEIKIEKLKIKISNLENKIEKKKQK